MVQQLRVLTALTENPEHTSSYMGVEYMHAFRHMHIHTYMLNTKINLKTNKSKSYMRPSPLEERKFKISLQFLVSVSIWIKVILPRLSNLMRYVNVGPCFVTLADP